MSKLKTKNHINWLNASIIVERQRLLANQELAIETSQVVFQ